MKNVRELLEIYSPLTLFDRLVNKKEEASSLTDDEVYKYTKELLEISASSGCFGRSLGFVDKLISSFSEEQAYNLLLHYVRYRGGLRLEAAEYICEHLQPEHAKKILITLETIRPYQAALQLSPIVTKVVPEILSLN